MSLFKSKRKKINFGAEDDAKAMDSQIKKGNKIAGAVGGLSAGIATAAVLKTKNVKMSTAILSSITSIAFGAAISAGLSNFLSKQMLRAKIKSAVNNIMNNDPMIVKKVRENKFTDRDKSVVAEKALSSVRKEIGK